MKKLFSLALAFVALSAMAEVQTLLSYTVSETYPTAKVNIPAGGQDSIYVGTESFQVNSTDIPGVYGWKMDGNLTEGNTKYVRLHVTEKFAAGDKIYIEGWSGSSASSSSPQGFALFDGYKEAPVTQYAELLDTQTAKKTLFEVSYTIPEESPLIGERRVYIGRQIDKSVFFHSVRVVRGEQAPEPEPEPEPVAADTLLLASDTLVLTKDMTVTPNMAFVAPHITMILSADTFKVSADTVAAMAADGFYAIMAGKVNPGPKNAAVPTEGAYYIFRPALNGHLYVPAKIGSGKKIDVSNGSFMNFYVGESQYASQTAVNTSGASLYDYIHFDVVAGQTYYVFGEGTKLGIYGFRFAPTGTDLMLLSTPQRSTKQLRNGQIIIVRNGIEYNALGTRL